MLLCHHRELFIFSVEAKGIVQDGFRFLASLICFYQMDLFVLENFGMAEGLNSIGMSHSSVFCDVAIKSI